MDVLKNLIKFIEKEGKIELSEEFQGKLEDAFKVVVSDKDVEIDGLKEIMGEAKEEIVTLRGDIQTLKESTLEDVKGKVEAHKEALTEKLSSYLESELGNLIPDALIEAQAKVEAYEPIVEKVKDVFKGYGVELDSDAHAVLKEAKVEIIGLKDSYDALVSEKLELETKTKELLAKFVLKEKCDGLTEEQAEKIGVVFKGSSVEEIEEKFDSVVDLIITESSDEGDGGEEGEGKGSEQIDESLSHGDQLTEVEDLGQKYLNL